MKLSPNINAHGRWMRGVAGIACIGTACAVWPWSRMATLGLGSAGAFMIFEATRGWCALRACGIKTPF